MPTPSRTLMGNKYLKSLLIHLINVARICVPIQWDTNPPTVEEWILGVNEKIRIEDLTSAIRRNRDRLAKFDPCGANVKLLPSTLLSILHQPHVEFSHNLEEY